MYAQHVLLSGTPSGRQWLCTGIDNKLFGNFDKFGIIRALTCRGWQELPVTSLCGGLLQAPLPRHRWVGADFSTATAFTAFPLSILNLTERT